MRIRTVLNASLCIAAATAAGAQQLTTVGVVDINRVYSAFFGESRQIRELERLREEYQAEIDAQRADLENLRNRRVDARQSGNATLESRLDDQIAELEREIADLARRRRGQLQSRQAELLSDRFVRDLQNAIEFAAESEGYTVVLRADSDGLQWWSPEVDISDAVLARLIATAGR